MNKQQLQQEIAELQKQLEEKQKVLAAMPDKWEPKGGTFWVDFYGDIAECDSTDKSRLFGTEYATLQQAEKAAKAMRAHNRLLAYVAEFAPDYEPNWDDPSEEKAYVSKSQTGLRLWTILINTTYKAAGNVYMPAHVASELARKLNSGEVEL